MRGGTFDILCVAQAGRLEFQALILAASLRRFAPGFAGRLVVAEPRAEGAWAGHSTVISDPVRAELQRLGAEVVPFTARHFGAAYPYGNKIEALSVLEPGRPFLFLDTDTLILGPLDRLEIGTPSASMRREDSWPDPPPYGPEHEGIWASLYERFGLDIGSSLDPAYLVRDWRRYLYFNAGWFCGPDPAVFGQRFLDWALAVRNDPGEALACQSLDPWLDQIVLPLVVHSLGGGRPGAGLAGLDGDLTCHYRNLPLLYARESEAAVAALEEAVAPNRIKKLLREADAAKRFIYQGKGGGVVRPMFPDRDRLPSEKPFRQRLKAAGWWLP